MLHVLGDHYLPARALEHTLGDQHLAMWHSEQVLGEPYLQSRADCIGAWC